MRYIEWNILSQKNQKFIDKYFQESIFSKFDLYAGSHQTKPNQPEWYTTSKSKNSLPKKISGLQVHRGPRKWTKQVENLKNLYKFFFKKMGPQGPPKGLKSIPKGSWVVLDPKDSPKKISSISGTGCHKVCTCWLNGALRLFQHISEEVFIHLNLQHS